MITIEDVLPENVKYKLGWPLRDRNSPLVNVYKKLRLALFNGDLGFSNSSHFQRSLFSRDFRGFSTERIQSSNGMVVSCQNEGVLRSLSNKKYIYLTAERLFMQRPYSCADEYEYVAILKKEGRIGYCVLILGFNSADYSFGGSEHEEYGSYFNLIEVFSDGTTILFDRCLPWHKVKSCRANTTSIRNLFFNPEEQNSIQSILQHVVSNQNSDKNEIYSYYIGEDLSERLCK